MNKRTFLKSLSAISIGSAGFLLPGRNLFASTYENVRFDTSFWHRPRRLYILRPEKKEHLNITFYQNGAYDYYAYKKLCWLFRDIKSRDSTQFIDIALFNLIFGIQEWSRNMGSYEPIYKLYSGYRTHARNRTIEGAAKNSMHIYGKAADGIFASIPLKNIIQMANYFGAGGVGEYPSFVHLDTSKVRKWSKVR